MSPIMYNDQPCSATNHELYNRPCLRYRRRKYEEQEGMVEWRHETGGEDVAHGEDSSSRITDADTTVDSAGRTAISVGDPVPISDTLSDSTLLSSSSDEDDGDSDLAQDGAAGGMSNQGMMITTPDGHAVQPPAAPTYGNVVVNNSSDVHFGNNTFYNGPVTIKQFLYSTQNSVISDDSSRTLGPAATTQSSSDIPNQDLQNGSAFKVPEERFQPRKTPNYTEDTLSQWLSKAFKSRRCLALVVLGTCTMLVMVVLAVIYVSKTPRTQVSANIIDGSEEEGANAVQYNGTAITPSGKLRILERRQWLAQPPTYPTDPLHHPVPYVIILHTATENCSTQAECVFIVRQIQTYHMESYRWWDIGYSFLIGGDTNVYEGRGWDKQGAFVYGYNNVSIGIAFIGTFIANMPNNTQIVACKQLINKGVQLGKIAPNYKLLAHRQLSATESPGTRFFENLQTWPHWAERP